MKSIHYYFIILNLLAFHSIKAQQNEVISKEIGISIGWTSTQLEDRRLSNQKAITRIPKIQMSFKTTKSLSKSELNLAYQGWFGKRSSDYNIRFLRPVVNYSYERKVKNIWLGGFFSSTTLLSFPIDNYGTTENNPISYTIAQSIGPKLSWNPTISNSEEQRLYIESSTQLSLLNYIIRPAYAHPYPDNYLESGTFSPTRRNMAWPLAKSGKISTINKYQAITVKFGLFYQLSNRLNCSINFQFDYNNYNSTHSNSFQSTEALIAINYIY